MKKFNIIDIGMILLVLVLVVVGILKTSKYNYTKSDGTMDKIEYTILVAGIRQYSVDTFKVGDTVYDSQTKLNIGTIKKIEVGENEYKRDGMNGELVYTNVPEKFNVLLTIETDGLENDTGYFADRSVELKVGSDKQFETMYIKTNGIIKGIKNKAQSKEK